VYQKTMLDNGLRVVTMNMPYTCSVATSIFIGTGSRYEADAQAGISHFIEHLCFRGTAKRPTAREISMAIEGVGGILNGATDKELCVYWCKVARPHFTVAIDVLTDILINPRFEPVEIEKECQVIIEEINMGRDSPPQRAAELIDELLWPGHPLGRDAAGTKESVMATTRDKLISYRSSHYHPANTVIAIAGDIQHEDVVETVSQFTANWGNRTPRPEFMPYQEQPGKRVRIDTREMEQAQICLALPGLSLLHPQRYTLDLLNVVLGEGMSSRLFAEIRDRLGLAYSIQSYVDHFLDAGSLIIAAGVEPKNLKTAITAILEELAKLKERIPEAELSKAKELSKGRLMLRMEDSRNVSGWMGGQEILTGRILSPNQIIAIIDAVTTEASQQLANELLAEEALRLAVVGPIPKDEPLEELLKL